MTQKPSVLLMLSSAVLYGVCSCSMNFLNKFLLSSWAFNHPASMVLGQILVIMVLALKLLKLIGKINLVNYDIVTATSCGLLSVLFSANTIMALFALRGMNVPMYNAIRRCIPFASMVLGYMVFVKKPSPLVFISIMIVTAGTGLA
uniref:Sugar phosphate transporter domain-containing protein n=1 Tax=Ciona savignyi TaxID=51511 RepID=H2ZQ07_CIOSA